MPLKNWKLCFGDFSFLHLRQNLWAMNIQKEILCPECGKDFGTLPRFHKHFRQYHMKNESKCTNCDKTFNTAYILRQHVTNVHETQKCNICDLDMAKGALQRHKIKHREIKFECEKCDNVYTRKDMLQKHNLICGTEIVRVVKAQTFISKTSLVTNMVKPSSQQ